MASCEHIAWLQTADTKELHFRDGNQMKRVIQEMPNPIAQYPSHIFFIGQKAKNIALRELFPHNNIKRGRHECKTYPLRWKPSPEYSMFNIVHAQLFFLFTDVICIFADDFDGLEQIVERLVAWAIIGSASNLPGLT